MTNPLFSKISDAIAAQLEAGVRPWSKPWTSVGAPLSLPVNRHGRPYRGGNVFWLWIAAQHGGFASNVWMTYNQAKAEGGNIKKGEKGTPVYFWNFPPPKEDGSKPAPWCKVYTVFNLDQCEGLPCAPAPVVKSPAQIVEEAERVIAASGAKIAYGGSRAYYVPTTDAIRLPEACDFKSSEAYYGTAFHELGHWTGHESRLARTFGKAFGDEKYAAEELVAELTAAFVCGAVGIASFEREDHAGYIGQWIKLLKADPSAFTSAAGKAQAAADYILKLAAVSADHQPQREAA